jgi:hypothetical protein
VLCLEPRDVDADLRVGPMSLQKAADLRASIAEQRLMDELDRRRRPLDVQEDGADLLQLEAVLSGM